VTALQHDLEEVPDEGPTGRPWREVPGPAPGGGAAAPPPTDEEEGEGEEKEVREVHCGKKHRDEGLGALEVVI